MPKVSPEHFKKRRMEILEAARRAFSNKGFEPTTMQDVVKETGMSRGGVYQYFSSTEEMLVAIRESNSDNFKIYCEALLETYDSVWEGLLSFINGYADRSETDNLSFAMVSYEYAVVAWRNEGRRKVMMDTAQKAIDTLTEYLQIGVDRGEFRPLFPLEAIVLFIFNVTDGLILYYMLAEKNMELTYIKEQVDGLKLYLTNALQVQKELKERNEHY